MFELSHQSGVTETPNIVIRNLNLRKKFMHLLEAFFFNYFIFANNHNCAFGKTETGYLTQMNEFQQLLVEKIFPMSLSCTMSHMYHSLIYS